MKAEELRKLSSEDLNKKLNELKEELFRLRFQLQINQLDNPNKIPETKRNIAREAMILESHKLPIKTRFVNKDVEVQGEEE